MHLWVERGLTICRGAGVAGVEAAVSLPLPCPTPSPLPYIHILDADKCTTEIAFG